MNEYNRLTATTSASLALIRWPLGLVIVAVHWFAFYSIETAGLTTDESELCVYMNLCRFVESFLSDCSVGLFFFISGYLFCSGAPFSSATYWNKLKRRVHTLLIPYLLWNILMVAAALVWESPVFEGVFPYRPGGFSEMSAVDFFTGLLGLGSYMIPHNGNMWFIRNLMLGVLLVPLFVPLLRKRPLPLLCVCSVGFIWFSWHGDFFLTGIFAVLLFFNWGASMGLRRIELSSFFKPMFMPAMILYLVCGVSLFVIPNRYGSVGALIKTVEIFAAIVFVVNLAVWLVERFKIRPVRFLTAATFFMFAFHPLVIGRFQWFLALRFAPTTDLELTSLYIAGFFVLIVSIHLCFYILHRFTPSLLGVLIGKRL